MPEFNLPEPPLSSFSCDSDLVEFGSLPLPVSLSQVVVDCNNMYTPPIKCIQVRREQCNKSFSFSSLHFSNLAFVQDHPTNLH